MRSRVHAGYLGKIWAAFALGRTISRRLGTDVPSFFQASAGALMQATCEAKRSKGKHSPTATPHSKRQVAPVPYLLSSYLVSSTSNGVTLPRESCANPSSVTQGAPEQAPVKFVRQAVEEQLEGLVD